MSPVSRGRDADAYLTTMRSLAIGSLSIRGFRNIAKVDVELGPHFNVVYGDNGQGKTNLLEAVYVLATSRSFRTAKLPDLVQVGVDTASLRATVDEAGESREQTLGLRRGLRAARIDGKRTPTLAEYALRTPVVVFHAASIDLSSGAGAERRKLLDRVALYLSPASLAELDSYTKAMRARQRVLETRGESAVDLDGWEALMVQHGTATAAARRGAAARLAPSVCSAFDRIGPPGVPLSIEYVGGAPADPGEFLLELRRRRTQDRSRKSATIGPHRDDLKVTLGALPTRGMASQGQHRAVVLALDLAEIEVVTAARGVRPVLLLDDVSSELDRARTAALLDALRDQQGQVILTTTRPELLDGEPRIDDAALGLGAPDQALFEVHRGEIRRR
jgi:DNA replication and repair protein RecF